MDVVVQGQPLVQQAGTALGAGQHLDQPQANGLGQRHRVAVGSLPRAGREFPHRVGHWLACVHAGHERLGYLVVVHDDVVRLHVLHHPRGLASARRAYHRVDHAGPTRQYPLTPQSVAVPARAAQVLDDGGPAEHVGHDVVGRVPDLGASRHGQPTVVAVPRHHLRADGWRHPESMVNARHAHA